MIAPSILVLDSGLGGLSVLRALRETVPHAPLLYIADTAAFPYGSRSAEEIGARANEVIGQVMQAHAIGLVVIACNTLSTLCLASLRTQYAVPFVGTVPAIKVAAERSQSRRFTLLATPNTADSVYSNELIARFASDCHVDKVGAPNLARLAEQYLLDGTLDRALLTQDIVPCFHDDAKGRTDILVLGCTHYPFLADAIAEAAPWPVHLIDPAFAIARQAGRLWSAAPLGEQVMLRAFVTRAADVARYQPVFSRFGFSGTASLGTAQAA